MSVASSRHLLRWLQQLSRRESPWSQVESRAKVLVTLGFLLSLASYPPTDLTGPLPLALYVAVGLTLADVPWALLRRFLMLASPFALTLVLAAPFVDRRPMASVFGLTMTVGLWTSASLCLRLILAVSAIVILAASTSFDTIASALRRLGMPPILAEQLLLLHRYLELLFAEAESLVMAHRLRAPKKSLMNWKTFVSLLVPWLTRSLVRAERVHAAMQCRGFGGRLMTTARSPWRHQDSAFLAGWLLFLILCRLVPVVTQVGVWTTQWLQ